MQKLGFAFALALFLIPAGSAFGQIDGGDFRLGLTGGLFSYTSASLESDGTDLGSTSQWGAGFNGVGPAAGSGGVNFGWTVGYAINPAIEVGTHLTLGFGGGSSETPDGTSSDAPSTLTVWALPYFHYNLQVSKPLFIVFEAAAGYLRNSSSTSVDNGMGGTTDVSTVTSGGTFGPGIGLDFFLTKNFSVDLMLNYQFGLLSVETDPSSTTIDISAHVIMFRLGISGWMGGK